MGIGYVKEEMDEFSNILSLLENLMETFQFNQNL